MSFGDRRNDRGTVLFVSGGKPRQKEPFPCVVSEKEELIRL